MKSSPITIRFDGVELTGQGSSDFVRGGVAHFESEEHNDADVNSRYSSTPENIMDDYDDSNTYLGEVFDDLFSRDVVITSREELVEHLERGC